MGSPPRILDGGLATTLEEAGVRLHPRLWSAATVLERPEAIERVHRAFLEAGAEIVIGASYQMSYEGLEREGLDRATSDLALRETVALARRAVAKHGLPATVAASIGPYGAALADGSEYTGDYRSSREALARFHRERLETLSGAAPDMLAIETIPSIDEAAVLHELLDASEGPPAWVSFTCRDDGHLRDGASLAEAASLFERSPRVEAVGVNCTPPELVDGLIETLRRGSSKRIVVYPNSGEHWDPAGRRWTGERSTDRFVELARGWAARGVWAIGGCCRVGPATIERLAAALGGGA